MIKTAPLASEEELFKTIATRSDGPKCDAHRTVKRLCRECTVKRRLPTNAEAIELGAAFDTLGWNEAMAKKKWEEGKSLYKFEFDNRDVLDDEKAAQKAEDLAAIEAQCRSDVAELRNRLDGQDGRKGAIEAMCEAEGNSRAFGHMRGDVKRTIRENAFWFSDGMVAIESPSAGVDINSPDRQRRVGWAV